MMKHAALGFAALAMVTAGCANQGGPSQNQTTGAVTGAALGAATGALVAGGNRGKGALIGAGIGLLAGAAVGTYLDRQQQELEQNLAGTGADVTRVNDQLMVTLPAGITFDVDSANIRPEFYGPLNSVAQTFNRYPQSYIDVVGHTDSTGSEAYNQTLSQRRADSVLNYLAAQGVMRGRMVAYGRGESQPIASNATPEGRQANRRVELIITPATQG